MRSGILILLLLSGLVASEPLTVAIDVPDARAGGLFVAIDGGLPPRYGLSVQVMQRPRGETLWSLLASGQAQAALVSDRLFTAWGEGHDVILLATTHGPDARVLVAREEGGPVDAAALIGVSVDRLPQWPEGVPVAWLLQTQGLQPSAWQGGRSGLAAFLNGEVVAWPATWRERAQLAELGVKVRPLLQPTVGFGVALVASRSAWQAESAQLQRLRDLVLAGWRLAQEQPSVLVTALAARNDTVPRGMLLQEAELALAALDPTPLPQQTEILALAQRLRAVGIPVELPAIFIAEVAPPHPWGTWVLLTLLIVLVLVAVWHMRWNRQTPRGEDSKASVAQRHLLSDLPDLDGWEIGVHYRPHSEVSGDFYICAALADSRALIVVGDVSGHGVQAAIVASAVAKAGEVLAPAQRSLGAWLIALEAAIAGDLPRGQFVTLVAVALDPWSGAIECARAGHPPAYLLDDDDQGHQHELGPIGLALGLSTREAFAEQVRTESLHLAPGSDILLFTDGLTEVFDRAGEEYGSEGLKRSIARHRSQGAQTFVDAIARDAISHAAHGPEDDLTALVIRRVRATVIPQEEAG